MVNGGIFVYENIVIDKVIVKIGLVLVKVFKFVIYLKWFWCNVKIMVNILMVINI